MSGATPTVLNSFRALGEDTYGFYFSGACAGCNAFTFLPLIWASGGDVLSEDATTPTLEDPAVRAALEFYHQMWADGLMPARTDPSAAIVQAVRSALEEVHGRPPVIYPTSAGSGPMYELCQAYGIDVASAGVGWYGSRAHAPDESVRLADLFAGIRWVGRLFERFARA